MTQSPNQARQPRNWLNLAQFAFWIASVLALLAAIAIQPLFAVLLPALIAMGLNLWQARQAQTENLRDRQALQQQFNRAVSELKLQLQQQNGKINEIIGKLAQFQKERPQNHQESQEVRQALQTAINRLETEVGGVRAKINQIPDLGPFQGQIATLQSENRTLAQQGETLQAAIATLQQNFQDLTDIPGRFTALSQALVSLEAKFQEHSELIAQFPDIHQNITNLQALHAQIQDSSTQQTQTFGAAIAQIEQRNNDYLKLFQQTEALRATIGHFEHRLQKITENEVSLPLNSDLTPVYDQLQQLSSRVASLQAQSDRRFQPEDLVSLEAAISSLENQQSEVRNAIAKVNQKNKQLKTQVATQIQQIHSRFNSLETPGNLTQLQDAVASLENQSNSGDLEIFRMEISTLRNQLLGLRDAIANLENQSYSEVFQTIREDINRIQTQVNQSVDSLGEITRLRDAIANLENQSNSGDIDIIQENINQLATQLNPAQPVTLETQWRLLYQFNSDSSGTALAIAPNNEIFASDTNDYKIKTWNLQNHQEIKTLSGHEYHISALDFSPDSRLLASGGSDKVIKIWDIETEEIIHNLEKHSQEICTVAFSRDGTKFASGGKDNKVKVSDTETGETLKTLTGHWGQVNAIAFSPDGITFASGSAIGTAKIWNIESGELIKDYLLASPIYDLAYSPNNRILYAACENKTIKCINTQTGKQQTPLIGHTDAVLSVTISPDGTTAASSSSDGTIKLWSLASGEEIGELQRGDTTINKVRFSIDGMNLVSLCETGFIQVWSVI
ncbi:MAG: hypothetical protein ACLFV6_04155 [Spirulinaceae cyanobacterium]